MNNPGRGYARARPRRGDSFQRGGQSWQSPRRGSPGASASSNPRGGYRGAGAPHAGRGQPHLGGVIPIDARIRDNSDKAIVADLNRKEHPGPHGLPLRPDFGTQGRAIPLRVNHFPVQIKGRIFRYAAAIALLDGRKITRTVKHHVFSLAEQTEDWRQAGMTGRVAHDNAERLVAALQLPQPLTMRGKYHDQGNATEYELSLTFEEEVDQHILKECLQGNPVDSQSLAKVLSALNLILTAHPSQTGVKIGRNDDEKKHPDQRFFFDTPTPKDIGGGLTARQGFYTSVRPAHQQLMVNVNTCHAAFYKPQSCINAVDEYMKFGGNPSDFGRNVRVSTQPSDRVIMINGLYHLNARQHKFKHNEYGLVTIEQYYVRKHDIKLQYPDRRLLKTPGNDSNYYPQEVCHILPDQGFKGELSNREHASAMLNQACKRPKENAGEIVNRGLPKLGFRGSNPVLESFGVSVGADMAVVPGRVLDKPGLAYSQDTSANVQINDRASWNLRDIKFAVGARLDKWAVLAIQDGGNGDFGGARDPGLKRIADGFCRMCNTCGMRMRPLDERAYAHVRLPPQGDKMANPVRKDAIKEIEGALKDLVARVRPELVLVMLSNNDQSIYGGLKRLCDVELDLATVCVQSSKVRSDAGQKQYFANVALKVNMKMGGINHTLDEASGAWLKSAPTMIMGMDVTHPTGKAIASGTPSIVAVVASIDDRFAQYPAILGLRKSKVEIDSNDLVDMFVSRFELYKIHNGGRLPERVVLFRDGVSESQFAQVRRDELPQMEKAFRLLGSAYRPKLSIVVCGKRHNTRFYPTQAADAAVDDNPLPGTVVDRGVTLAYEFDFFLQAHASLKGTARPTHYFVVHDENAFKADDLQRVTYDLSYMFARATKAVSLVSPAYWADVACERGRCYLNELLRCTTTTTTDIDAPRNETGGVGGVASRGRGRGGGRGRGKVVLDRKGKGRADAGDPKNLMFATAERMWGNGVSGPKLRDTMFYL